VQGPLDPELVLPLPLVAPGPLPELEVAALEPPAPLAVASFRPDPQPPESRQTPTSPPNARAAAQRIGTS
jgi:hypothetical protein